MRVVFRFCFNACALIQSFSGRFIFLHLSTLQSSDFPGSHGAKKPYRLVMLSARALRSFYFSMFSLVFFQGVWKPCIAGPKRLQTELTNITRQHFCSLPFFVLNIPLFTFSCRNFCTLFVSFDILWQLATTHPRDNTRDRDANSSRQNDVTWDDFLQGKQVKLSLSLILPQKT